MIDDLRRRNLAQLATEAGGVGKLAERIGRDPSQVSQWLNASKDSRTGRPRGMRSQSCREIEAALGKPVGWLDSAHDDAGRTSVVPWPFSTIEPGRYEQLPERVKGLIEGRIAAMIDDWEAANKAMLQKSNT